MPELASPSLVFLLWAVIGYALGAIPFGLLLTRAMGTVDPRGIGSGNIGATNVLRTGNKSAAAGTLLLDAAKGAVAVLLARWLGGPDTAQVAALAAFVGHCYPVWLGFCGGKGVATFLGVLLALAWPAGLLACATWLVAALGTRISSLGALGAAVTSPLWATVVGRADLLALTILLALLMFWRHRANIARLRAGTEPRFGRKR